MARVRQRGTAPELLLRALLRRHAVRFTVNRRGLPGSPDIVAPGLRRALFVHGCFWHRHRGCAACTTPKRNAEFWTEKFRVNRARDRRKIRELEALGYAVMTVWECQLRSPTKRVRLERRVLRFLVEG
jgi:DNA mismatch endonuclease (patch repair protein)